MEVTILRFRISNKASTIYEDDVKTSWYKQEIKQLSSSKQISETLSEFMKGRILLNCQVTPITCKQNNDRDRDDTVDVLYTIFWEPAEDFEEAEKERKMHYSALEESLEKIVERADKQNETPKVNPTIQNNMGYGLPPKQMPQNRWNVNQAPNQNIQQNNMNNQPYYMGNNPQQFPFG